jgi:D-serine deaminase-like pyridoxal phosphate-dependent protein
MSLDRLPTPAPVVDLDVLERNLARMALRAQQAGLALRPHAKTHKTLQVARLQLAEGAVGLTVAKTAEAEVYAGAGFEDIFVAYPVVGLGKPERLLAVARRARLAVGVDSVEGARALGVPFAAAAMRLRVRIEIDCGQRRTGVRPEETAALARAVAALPGLELEGVFTHGGHAYEATSEAERASRAREEAAQVASAAAAIREAGLPCPVVSLGSTPTLEGLGEAMGGAGVTEARPGNYVFHDATQVALGSCALEDCALSVLATVVSVPAPDRAVLDAGSKALAADGRRPTPDGHGIVAGTRSRVARLSEEHGVVAVAPGDAFHVGQRVRVIPNHACVVSNLHDVLYAVRRGEVEEGWPVAARGRVE